ncbi:MAG TPA: 4-hydroxy-3-methylbut-2-enyl diphosphate reductase [Rhizomicrobium sp.]|nr:4-hydroxy-3-methylbut-2-enyl diphosphate reductase [Rhizomicrobium sp.]
MESREGKEPGSSKPFLTLLLASPRGFCAGVERAVRMVELALTKFGAPVYVRHEIVHNRFVVDRLRRLGAIFIDQLSEAPEGAHVIFSAHGVARCVAEEAEERHLVSLDATCPLVSKVHVEARQHFRQGREIVLVGHAGHPEVEGTMGQLPDGAITLIQCLDDVAKFVPKNPDRLAFITQTTLSVDDAAQIVSALKRRFPNVAGPRKEDICYATTNRQEALKRIAPESDCVLVVGAPNSSNSQRLVDVALRAGAKHASLIQSAAEIDWQALRDAHVVSLTAGASAPETLVEDVIAALRAHFDLDIREAAGARESVIFNVPRALAV